MGNQILTKFTPPVVSFNLAGLAYELNPAASQTGTLTAGLSQTWTPDGVTTGFQVSNVAGSIVVSTTKNILDNGSGIASIVGFTNTTFDTAATGNVLKLDGVAVVLSGLTANQVLLYNGTNWVNSDAASVTSYTAPFNNSNTVLSGQYIGIIPSTGTVSATLFGVYGEFKSLTNTLGVATIGYYYDEPQSTAAFSNPANNTGFHCNSAVNGYGFYANVTNTAFVSFNSSVVSFWSNDLSTELGFWASGTYSQYPFEFSGVATLGFAANFGRNATSTGTLQNAYALDFLPQYWNGTATTSYRLSIIGVMDTTTPTAHWSFQAGLATTASGAGNSTANSYLTGNEVAVIDYAGNFHIKGSASITSNLLVTGFTNLSSTLGVSGATTLSSTLSVSGASTLAGVTFNTLASSYTTAPIISLTGAITSGNYNQIVPGAATVSGTLYGWNLNFASMTSGGSTAPTIGVYYNSPGSTATFESGGDTGFYVNQAVTSFFSNVSTNAFISFAATGSVIISEDVNAQYVVRATGGYTQYVISYVGGLDFKTSMIGFINNTGPLADSTNTLTNAYAIDLIPQYYNGTTSTDYRLSLIGVMDTTAPKAHWSFQAGLSVTAAGSGNSTANSYLTGNEVFVIDSVGNFLGGGHFHTGGGGTAPTSVTVPASGTAYTASTIYNTILTVSGGAVTAIAINGTSTGLISGTFYLKANDTITFTYTTAPTVLQMYA